jgi:MYXO-CTERM domain-containing protein
VNGTGETGCISVSTPIVGSLAAYNSFDGDGPQTFWLKQSIVVPNQVTSATLSWWDTAAWNIISGPSIQNRTFSIDLYDGSNSLLGTLFQLTLTAGTTGAYGWTARSADATALLAAHGGETVTLAASNIIPQTFTGGAGFGADDFSLQVTTAPAPEPGGMALLATGVLGLLRRRRTAA